MVDVPPELPQWLAVGGGSAWAARKLFGGSLDVVGEALERWTRSRLENVGRITENALKKSGTDLETPGVVPARVAMRVFDEGSYSDDAVVTEYLGGVLASSRTAQGRDDRGNTWTKLVAGLSTYELRYHYICYRLLRDHVVGDDLNLHDMGFVQSLALYIPREEMDLAMDFEPDEDSWVIRDHCEYGLMREQLLAEVWTYTDIQDMQRLWRDAPEPGALCFPSTFGILLYMWAHGAGTRDLNAFLDPACRLEFVDVDFSLPTRSTLLCRSGGDTQPALARF
jgi:hypothetical protein